MKKLKLMAASLLLSVSSIQCMNVTAITESAGQIVGAAGNVAYNGAAAVVGESALQAAGTGLSWAGWGLSIVGEGAALNQQWQLCQGVNYVSKLVADGHAPSMAKQIKNKILIAKIARDMGMSMRESADYIMSRAIEKGDKKIVQQLFDLGINIEKGSRQFIHDARNNLDMIEFLLDHGADINAKIWCGPLTPDLLSLALQKNDVEQARWLLGKGAQVNSFHVWYLSRFFLDFRKDQMIVLDEYYKIKDEVDTMKTLLGIPVHDYLDMNSDLNKPVIYLHNK